MYKDSKLKTVPYIMFIGRNNYNTITKGWINRCFLTRPVNKIQNRHVRFTSRPCLMVLRSCQMMDMGFRIGGSQPLR